MRGIGTLVLDVGQAYATSILKNAFFKKSRVV